MKNTDDNLLRLRTLSRRLNVPAIWIKKQAVNGKLPHINAGGVFLFNYKAVIKTLAKRARQGAK